MLAISAIKGSENAAKNVFRTGKVGTAHNVAIADQLNIWRNPMPFFGRKFLWDVFRHVFHRGVFLQYTVKYYIVKKTN